MEKAVNKQAMVQNLAFKGKSYEKYGLKFWGITMEHYEDWNLCKNVWLSRQSTFPVSYIMMPFLDAVFAMDMDMISITGKPGGYLYQIMYGLGLALGLNENCVRDKYIFPDIDEETRTLKSICVYQEEYDSFVEINADMFNDIREIIVWMQGEEMPDESLNDDLLEAERDLAERDAPKLKADLLDLECSVALAYHTRTLEIMKWTIIEFEYARRAIDRDKKYLICGIGATNGCKWEKGNPNPSWCFDRDQTESGALISQNQFGESKK